MRHIMALRPVPHYCCNAPRLTSTVVYITSTNTINFVLSTSQLIRYVHFILLKTAYKLVITTFEFIKTMGYGDPKSLVFSMPNSDIN